MTGHNHVNMFFDCVDSLPLCGIGTAWKDVRVLDKRDHIRSMATTRTLNVVGMNLAILECCSRPLHEAWLIQGVTVDLTLDVMLVTDPVAIHQ